MTALAIGGPLALAVIGWSALSAVALAGQGSYRVNLNLPVSGGTVDFADGAGDMRVTQTAGSRLRVTGIARYSFERSAVIWHRTPSGVSVTSDCRFNLTGVCSFDYQVALPAHAAPSLTDSAGNMWLRGLTGPVTASDGSGDIHAVALSGPVSLSADSGNISGATLTGPRVTLSNSSGDITISGLASATVSVVDDSGNITIGFTKVPSRVRISNDSGDIRLVLPRGNTLYKVSASTSAGSKSVSVPVSTASTHLIKVTDSAGNIFITEARG